MHVLIYSTVKEDEFNKMKKSCDEKGKALSDILSIIFVYLEFLLTSKLTLSF